MIQKHLLNLNPARTAGMLSGARRVAMLLVTLLLTMTAQKAWADTWPEYITNVVLVGGTESEAQTAKSDYSGYTWCDQKLNEGSGADIIYIGYKTSNTADTNGDYITDFIIIDAGSGTEGHNPPYSLTFQGRTYYRCPAAGGDYFVNSNHGNLTSQAANGWNMYLYYTKNSFDDKRAVSSINITKGEDTKSGSIDCYYKNGTLHEADISLNRGVSGTPFVYMHINTTTKVNRPNPEPTTISGLTYDGNPHQLIPSNYDSDNSGDVYFRVGTSGSYTSNVNNVTATNAGTYTIYYYSGESYYGNSSVDYAHTISATIAKSPNNGVTMSCADIVDGNAPAPHLGGTNLSTGAVTYQYSTTQNGTYTTTVPTDFGKYWVKATIAADGNCNAFTTAAASFWILADANDLWNIKGGANGTVDHPIIISTPSQLDLLAKKVNGTDGYTANGFSGTYFELGANITYDGTANNYTPIGTENAQDNVFGGHFDGKGHTVSGINIDTYAQWYKGLFGRIGSTAEVKNVTLSDATITGYQYTGGIVGYNNGGTVENCHVLSTVTVLGTKASAVYHGGIVGSNGGTVRGCTSAATVSYQSATYNMSYYGGIVGSNGGTVQNCLIYGGSVSGTFRVGAVVGNNYSGTLTNNHYTGVMLNGSEAKLNAGVGGDGSQDGTSYICAIIPYEGVTLSIPSVSATTEYPYDGLKIYPTGMTYNGQYYNYYSNNDAGISGDVTFTATYSGDVPEDYALSGFGSTSNATNTNVEMKWAATNGSATCTLCTSLATKYYIAPTFLNDIWGAGDGSQSSPYIIEYPSQLDLLAKKVNGTDGYTANVFNGKYFELGDDIEYDYRTLGENESNYEAIGNNSHKFAGHFDGKNYTISGIRIYKGGDNYQGLFGYIDNAEVKNVILADATITGCNYVGGIVGRNKGGTVTNCHVLDNVTVHTVQNNSTDHGGIAGISSGTITGCTSSAALTIADGMTYCPSYGGIVGTNASSGIVSQCLYLGTTLGGTNNVGAIVGNNIIANRVTNSYYTDTTIQGKDNSYNTLANAASAIGDNRSGTIGTTVGLAPQDNADNDGFISLMAARNAALTAVSRTPALSTAVDVTLNGRTLLKNDSWNTLCLPFSMTSTEIAASPLADAIIKELDNSTTGTSLSTDGTLTLKFTTATAIEAGKPYIVKWTTTGDNITDPVFSGFTIDNSAEAQANMTVTSNDEKVKFVGQWSPFSIGDTSTGTYDGDINEILYVASGNKIGYSASAPRTLKSFRAHFWVQPNGTSAGARTINLDFGDGETTSITLVNADRENDASGIYTLDGRKLSDVPTQKGVYIVNGKKIVVK